MSQQPQYTNVEEALRLHQAILRKSKLPLIDEAGYASLIITQQQQEELRKHQQQQQQEVSEPNYQEIGPAKPKRQLVHDASLTYENAAAAAAAAAEYPDLLKRSPLPKG